MKPTVVIDTNVLLSGLLWPRGNPYRCLALARLEKIDAVTCEAILDEFRDKLVGKFRFAPQRAAAARDEWQRVCRVVAVPSPGRVVLADPDDDVVIACALAGNATHIISGDRHLLTLGHHGPITIVSPATFLASHTALH